VNLILPSCARTIPKEVRRRSIVKNLIFIDVGVMVYIDW
jgi:hypothetical protein